MRRAARWAPRALTSSAAGRSSRVGGRRGATGVNIADGASTVRQALAAGVINELALDLAPVLLGSGERIFDGARSFGPAKVLHGGSRAGRCTETDGAGQ